MPELPFASNFSWGAYTGFFDKAASNIIGDFVHEVSFFWGCVLAL